MVKDFERERSSNIIQLGPDYHMSSYKWKAFAGCAQGEMRLWNFQKDVTLLSLKMQEGSHKPKNVSNFEKLEKSGKQILSYSLQKNTALLIPYF